MLNTYLNKISQYLFLCLAFLLPVFFLPFTISWFDFNKTALFFSFLSLLLIIWALKMVIKKEVRLTRTPFDSPLIFLAIVYLLSTAFSSLEFNNLFSFIISLFFILLYFVTVNLIKKQSVIDYMIYALFSSGFILSLLTLIQAVNQWLLPFFALPNSKLPYFAPFWSPTGSPLNQTLYLLLLLPLLPRLFALRKSHIGYPIPAGKNYSALKTIISAPIILSFLLLFIWTIKNPPIFMPLPTAWSVAVENLKQPLPAFLGSGPGYYLSAFARGRDIAYNMTSLWNLRFETSINQYLYLLTTVGLLGFTSYLFLIYRFIRLLLPPLLPLLKSQNISHANLISSQGIISQKSLPFIISLFLSFLLQIFFPLGFLAQFFFFFLLALFICQLKISSSLFETAKPPVYDIILSLTTVQQGLIRVNRPSSTNYPPTTNYQPPVTRYPLPAERSEILPFFFLVPAITLTLTLTYFASRVYSAEYYFYKSLQSAQQNKGQETYDLQRQAIRLNPWKDSFRTTASQTNLLLANSIASLPADTLTDNDRQTITQLIQQAIAEAKFATQLNSRNVNNFENLGNLYRSLINFAQDAELWAIAAYNTAISLDPFNPRLRIDLGGIYFTLQNYDLAIESFRRAVNLKPDFANARYNLAYALKANNKLDQAIAELQQAEKLVFDSSVDLEKVRKELSDWKKEQQEQATPSSQPLAPEIPEALEAPEATAGALPATPIPASPQTSPSPSPTPELIPPPATPAAEIQP